MDKSVPRVTILHHSAEPRDAKAMTLENRFVYPYLTLMSDSYIVLSHRTQISGFRADMGWQSRDGMVNCAESDQTALKGAV